MADAKPQRIIPGVQYEDVGAAIGFLTKAFGFREREPARMTTDGKVWHTEMDVVDMHVMLSTVPDYEDPRRHGHTHTFLYIHVDDVDAHHERARSAGAKIVEAPNDKFWGDRSYMAEDPAGHLWCFGQRKREVPPDELRPTDADVKAHTG